MEFVVQLFLFIKKKKRNVCVGYCTAELHLSGNAGTAAGTKTVMMKHDQSKRFYRHACSILLGSYGNIILFLEAYMWQKNELRALCIHFI